jgi:hypothetical protein
MTILHSFISVRILDCYSDPLGWKQKIQNQQHQGNSAKQFSTNKDNITVYRSVKDVTKLMSSTTELGGGIIYHKAFDLLLFLCFYPIILTCLHYECQVLKEKAKHIFLWLLTQ